MERFGLLYALAQILIPTALFLGLLAFVSARKNWARVVLVVVIGLSIPGYFLSLYRRPWGLTELVQLTNGLCFLGAGVLLLTRQSRIWFRNEADAA